MPIIAGTFFFNKNILKGTLAQAARALLTAALD